MIKKLYFIILMNIKMSIIGSYFNLNMLSNHNKYSNFK